MAVVTADRVGDKTLEELLEGLGSVPMERIAMVPAPGTATEEDLFTQEDRLYELVDGVLVEKTVGYYESVLAGVLIQLLRNFSDEHDLGIVLGESGTLRLFPGQVRVPDVSFISWDQFPGRELPAEPIPDLAPDLAVEVISVGNTKAEMARKLRDYFKAGVRLAWFVYPDSKTVHVYTNPDNFTLLTVDDAIDGGDVLPGFRLPVRDLFRRAGRKRGG